MTAIKKRQDHLSSECWNVEAIFPSFDNWQQSFDASIEQSQAPYWPSLADFRGRLHEGAAIVHGALDTLFTLTRTLEKLYIYAHLRHDEEITLDKHTSAFQKISNRIHDLQKESAWFEPEILTLPDSLLDQYIKSEPLKEYRFYIEKIIRKRTHTLTTDKEELLAIVQKPLRATASAFSALNNADIKFNPIKDSEGNSHPLTHSLFSLYLRSPDRELRKNAFHTMHTTFGQFENTLCELLSGTIKTHQFEAKARNFSSCLEAALFPNNIPTTVYHSLITTVRSHLPKLHKYMALRKKILGLDALHLYDIYVPLVSEVKLEFSYEEAEELVIRSTAPLGNEYQNILKKGLQEEGWVDRYENQNKRSGAYSSGSYDTHPYILMNYRKTVRDAFTLAHEAGHSMHSYLSHATQPYHDAQYPIFVAEVASTFNEELLMHLLLQTRIKREEKLFLINEQLENMRATLFRQTMFAEFELLIHRFMEEGIPLTPALLKEHYIQLNRDYFGPDVIIDDEIAIEWARIPHFYYNFYVYQYATGVSAAISLAEQVLNKEAHAKENYLTFLRGGSSLFPIDLLKLAGIDLTTSAPFAKALSFFEKQTEELEKFI